MASGEFGMVIKVEVESASDENDTNSEEKCDTLEVFNYKKEFEPEYVKSEDINMVLKSEECLEEAKEGSHCDVCGEGLPSPKDFYDSDSLKSHCNCQGQNGFNVTQDKSTSFQRSP
ncbi:uncharacterized protein isoform X2 [Leptinotarsa decemlineata]|uniref:uncharacterized protein isoform X2 n=1 Tax=Leptinotarsa decemlineata TaxID=7539 RepID=UPI003D307127